MVRIKGPFENCSGVLGDVVFVRRGGETFARKRPSKSKNPPTEAALEKEASFGLAGRIASAITSFNEIKHFWEHYRTGNQTSYNAIFKANYNQLNIMDLTGRIILSKLEGLEGMDPNITLSETGLFIECNLPDNRNASHWNEAKFIISAGVILLIKPKGASMPEYEIMKFKTKKCQIDKVRKIFAENEYTGKDLMKFQSYAIKKAFGVVITMDEEERVLEISKTITS
jgi:hypothetical protein